MNVLIMKRMFICIFLLPLMGCGHPKMIYSKPGLTSEEFNRDKYACVQESRTSWSGGGTDALGVAMIVSAKSNAEKESAKLFKMCMEARGYTAREVSDEEFEKTTSPFNRKLNKFTKENNDRCNNIDYKLIFEKSPCKPDKITLENISDKSFISEEEKIVFSKYRSDVNELNNKLMETIRTDGGPKDREYSLVLEQFSHQTDRAVLDLYEGRITWGEYNKSRKERAQALKAERKRIFENK